MTLFSRELRLVLCPQCGAPVEGKITGGSVVCRYCRAGLVVRARDESGDLAIAARTPTVSEAERIARLRAQEGRPFQPPAGLEYLLEGGFLARHLVPQAWSELQRALRELAMTGPSFGAAERLYFLALVLYDHLKQEGRDAEVRALLETARDHLSDPQHRQVLHGTLARNAARVGDFAAAEEWLRLLDPHAVDLRADTAFRFARAYVSTRLGDFATVLRVLETSIEDVPIADGLDEVCAVLRANALERMGQTELAAEQLALLMVGDAAVASTLAAIVAANPEIAPCPASLPLARARAQALNATIVHTRGGPNVAVLAVIALVLFAGTFGLDLHLRGALPEGLGVLMHVSLLLGSIGLAFLITRIGSALAREKKRALFARGTPGRAKILRMEETGTRMNDRPLMELRLKVHLPDRAYVAIHREVVPQALLSRVGVGSVLGVRVDPTDLAHMELEWPSDPDVRPQ